MVAVAVPQRTQYLKDVRTLLTKGTVVIPRREAWGTEQAKRARIAAAEAIDLVRHSRPRGVAKRDFEHMMADFGAVVQCLSCVSDCATAVSSLTPLHDMHQQYPSLFADICRELWRDYRFFLSLPEQNGHIPDTPAAPHDNLALYISREDYLAIGGSSAETSTPSNIDINDLE